MADWLTIEELAKQEGVTIDGARKRAQRGQYEKKKDGRRTLYRIFTTEAADHADGKREVSAPSAYLAAKAKKMAAEAELAELKLEEKKGEMARNTAELVIELFRDSFAPVIEHLYELDLNKVQLAKLRTMYRSALDDMKLRLEKLNASGVVADDEEE